MARRGRARRFREARQLKQGYDDGLFTEVSGTLADPQDADDADDDLIVAAVDAWSEYKDDEDDDLLKIDQRRACASESAARAGRGSTAPGSIS